MELPVEEGEQVHDAEEGDDAHVYFGDEFGFGGVWGAGDEFGGVIVGCGIVAGDGVLFVEVWGRGEDVFWELLVWYLGLF